MASALPSCPGSSPLTRGKRHEHVADVRGCGLIPAHAGKTKGASGLMASFPAHPRSRGENAFNGPARPTEEGSSPLTRGKLSSFPSDYRGIGLIPAHAGKTAPGPTSHTSPRAHPRSRGENPVEHFTAACRAGSSPLTRGKPQLQTARRDRRGLIPAHAGKTDVTRARCCAIGAHPRSRGENAGLHVVGELGQGSSPLTRGKPVKLLLRGAGHGLIPAHAGKT